MSRPSVAFLCSVLLVAVASGCGTLLNVGDGGLRGIPPEPPLPLPPPAMPFGGVWQDASRVTQSIVRIPTEPLWGTVSLLFFTADTPLSIAGDVVTLPLVAYYLWHDWEAGIATRRPELHATGLTDSN